MDRNFIRLDHAAPNCSFLLESPRVSPGKQAVNVHFGIGERRFSFFVHIGTEFTV